MRTFVLLFVLTMPLLAIGATAHAAASNDIGKPVCSHFDDSASSKATDAHAAQPSAAATATAAPTTGGSSSVGPVSPVTAKSGGSPTELRQHSSPRWQAFLPGMFR